MRTNPRKKPLTQADFDRQWREAANELSNRAVALLLWAVVDEFGFDAPKLQRLQEKIDYTSDSIVRGYLTIADIRKTLENEYGVTV